MIEILFDNDDYVVCVKPYGVISQYDSVRPNMVSMLAKQLDSDVFPVHRLDKTTGGVMVFAKSSSAAALLTSQIGNGTFKKEYLAIVHGNLTGESEMADLLYFDKKANKSYIAKKERKGVKKAVLHYRVLDNFTFQNEDYTLVCVVLKTGRTHQIRVQFASRKMSLAGDRRYGAKDGFSNISLWSHKIRFFDDNEGKILTFQKEPDEEFYIDKK